MELNSNNNRKTKSMDSDSNNDIQQLKKHLTLDLDSGQRCSQKKARQALLSACLPSTGNGGGKSINQLFSSPLLGGTSLWTPTGFVQLESPDLNKCQLPTPELERFILNNTSIHFTPTPSLANPQFAFELALERMKRKDEANKAAVAAVAAAAATVTSSSSSAGSPMLQFSNILNNSSNAAAAAVSNTSPTEESLLSQLIDKTPLDSVELQLKINQLLQRTAAVSALMDEQQVVSTVPQNSNSDSSRPPSNASSSFYNMNFGVNGDSCDGNSNGGTSMNSGRNSSAAGNTSSNKLGKSHSQMSTIDLEDQERLKLERKRMRNRIAASKCRKRKLERISKLEEKVKQLKGENSDLSSVIFQLREHVCQLKAEVMEHVKSGCNINASLAQS